MPVGPRDPFLTRLAPSRPPSHFPGSEVKRVGVFQYFPSPSLSFSSCGVSLTITAPTPWPSVGLSVTMHMGTSAQGWLPAVLCCGRPAELSLSFPSCSSLGHGDRPPQRGQPPLCQPRGLCL